MTQTITENIYASVTHNISQKSTAKKCQNKKPFLTKRLLICQKAASIVHQVSLVHAWSRLLLFASKNGRIDGWS